MDMNDTVIRYLVSCICLNYFSHCYGIIETLGGEYLLYDYLFLL